MSSVSAKTYLQMKAQLKEEARQRELLEEKYEECQNKLERMCDASEDQIEKAKVLVDQVAKLRASMSTAVPKDTHENLNSEFKNLQEVKTKIESENVELQRESEKIEQKYHKCQEDMLDAQGEVVKLKKKLDAARKSMKTPPDTQKLEHKVKLLENTLEVKQSEMKRISSQHKTEMKNIQHSHEESKAQAEKFRRALEKEMVRRKDADSRLGELTEKYQTLTEELEDSESKMIKMSKQLREAESKVLKMDALLQESETQKEKDDKIMDLEEKLMECKKSLETQSLELEESNMNFSEKLREKDEEINRLLSENRTLNEEADLVSEHGSYISGKSVSDLESEVTELKEKNNDLNFQLEKEKILHKAAKHNFDSDLCIDTDMEDFEIIECLNRKLLEKKLENQILHDKVRDLKSTKSVRFEDDRGEKNIAREKFNKLKSLFEEKLRSQREKREKVEDELIETKEKYRNLEKQSKLRIRELEDKVENLTLGNTRLHKNDSFDEFAYDDLQERYNNLKQQLKLSLANEDKLRQHILKLRNRLMQNQNEY